MTVVVSVVQSLSCVWPFVTPWTAAHQGPLSFIVFQSLLKFMSIDSVMLSTISLSVAPFSFCLQSFPASVFSDELALRIWWPKYGVSASALVLPMSIQDWFPLGLAGLISLQFKGLSRVFSNTTVQKHQFFITQPSLWFNSRIHTWLLEKLQHYIYCALYF